MSVTVRVRVRVRIRARVGIRIGDNEPITEGTVTVMLEMKDALR